MFFRADNPPYGTMISYYLPENLGPEVSISIADTKDAVVRILKGPGTAGIHRLNWDLKRENRVTDAQATQAGVTTISEREALDRVGPGTYQVTLAVGAVSAKNTVVVRSEAAGVKVGQV